MDTDGLITEGCFMDITVQSDDLFVSNVAPVEPIATRENREDAAPPEKTARRLELANEAIGQASVRQFRRMNQDFDTATLIYSPGSMEGRGTVTPSDPIMVMIKDVNAWMNWVMSDWWSVQREIAVTRANKKSDEYWTNIKKNFQALLENHQHVSVEKNSLSK